MNLSLMFCQMMRVISSPSSSTTGFLTLILVTIVRSAAWANVLLRKEVLVLMAGETKRDVVVRIPAGRARRRKEAMAGEGRYL